MKTCSKCQLTMSLSEFVKRNNREHAYQSYCKMCHNKTMRLAQRTDYMRNYDLIKSYGINVEEYEKLLKKQDSKCAICNGTAVEKMKGKKKYLCVDHCHNTGKIRGLLCDPCNRAIGLLGENIQQLQSAITYLKGA